MRMYIPEIGDVIKLAEPWEFNLFGEYRNASLIEHFGLEMRTSRYGELESQLVTLPKGTELSIDRVYIRRGAKEFSSVTFNFRKHKGGRVRFWVKLSDVNKMVFTLELQNVQLTEQLL